MKGVGKSIRKLFVSSGNPNENEARRTSTLRGWLRPRANTVTNANRPSAEEQRRVAADAAPRIRVDLPPPNPNGEPWFALADELNVAFDGLDAANVVVPALVPVDSQPASTTPVQPTNAQEATEFPQTRPSSTRRPEEELMEAYFSRLPWGKTPYSADHLTAVARLLNRRGGALQMTRQELGTACTIIGHLSLNTLRLGPNAKRGISTVLPVCMLLAVERHRGVNAARTAEMQQALGIDLEDLQRLKALIERDDAAQRPGSSTRDIPATALDTPPDATGGEDARSGSYDPSTTESSDEEPERTDQLRHAAGTSLVLIERAARMVLRRVDDSWINLARIMNSLAEAWNIGIEEIQQSAREYLPCLSRTTLSMGGDVLLGCLLFPLEARNPQERPQSWSHAFNDALERTGQYQFPAEVEAAIRRDVALYADAPEGGPATDEEAQLIERIRYRLREAEIEVPERFAQRVSAVVRACNLSANEVSAALRHLERIPSAAVVNFGANAIFGCLVLGTRNPNGGYPKSLSWWAGKTGIGQGELSAMIKAMVLASGEPLMARLQRLLQVDGQPHPPLADLSAPMSAVIEQNFILGDGLAVAANLLSRLEPEYVRSHPGRAMAGCLLLAVRLSKMNPADKPAWEALAGPIAGGLATLESETRTRLKPIDYRLVEDSWADPGSTARFDNSGVAFELIDSVHRRIAQTTKPDQCVMPFVFEFIRRSESEKGRIFSQNQVLLAQNYIEELPDQFFESHDAKEVVATCLWLARKFLRDELPEIPLGTWTWLTGGFDTPTLDRMESAVLLALGFTLVPHLREGGLGEETSIARWSGSTLLDHGLSASRERLQTLFRHVTNVDGRQAEPIEALVKSFLERHGVTDAQAELAYEWLSEPPPDTSVKEEYMVIGCLLSAIGARDGLWRRELKALSPAEVRQVQQALHADLARGLGKTLAGRTRDVPMLQQNLIESNLPKAAKMMKDWSMSLQEQHHAKRFLKCLQPPTLERWQGSAMLGCLLLAMERWRSEGTRPRSWTAALGKDFVDAETLRRDILEDIFNAPVPPYPFAAANWSWS